MSITIPAGVMDMEGYIFNECTNLKEIKIDENNAKYASSGGILFNKDKTELLAYPSASGDLTIPSGVTKIGSGAFSDAVLTGIVIPAGITEIGYDAFGDCTNLEKATILASVTEISDSVFKDCTSLTSITIPESVTTIRHCAFSNCISLTSVTIPGNMKEIGNEVFRSCIGLKTIYVANEDEKAKWTEEKIGKSGVTVEVKQ